jgi:hypothetical protein
MTLLNPWWLALLPLWPLLLFFLRTRQLRRPVLVADFLLWQQAAARLPRAALQSRLSWRDLAWIAPPVLLTLGLAEPELKMASPDAAVLVLLDGSASMETLGPDGSTRADRGLREARRLLGSTSHEVEKTATRALVEAAVMIRAAGRAALVVTDREIRDLPQEIGLVQVADDAVNAGIVSAGFDPDSGLLVRAEGDQGAGPRTLTVSADGRVLETRTVPDGGSARVVIPAGSVAGAAAVVAKLDPPDAVRADDVVHLEAASAPIRVAVAPVLPSSVERALRAALAEIVRGGEADITLLVAPLSGEGGFETGPGAPREGTLELAPGFEGLAFPTRWERVYPLVKEPAGTERLLEVAGAPILVRHGRTFALLADGDATTFFSLPAFPLAIVRILESAAPLAGKVLVVRPPAVLSPEETHVARAIRPLSRPPLIEKREPARQPLAPWIFGAAAFIMSVLGLWERRET